MIAHRDFAPRFATPRGLSESLGLKEPPYETFDDAVRAANEWIRTDAVKVLSIETVVLPNIWSEGGTADVALGTASGWASWYQFVRVWYQAP